MSHTREVAEIDEDFAALGAELIWVLEADNDTEPGTAAACSDVMDQLSDPIHGWCVGDGQTWPEAGMFDDSPFSQGRGFDMIVDRKTMTVEWVSNHGSPSGNENPSAAEVLAAVQDVVSKIGD